MLLPMAVCVQMAAVGEHGLSKKSLDPQRTHWLGALQTEEYHDVLAVVMCTSISRCLSC